MTPTALWMFTHRALSPQFHEDPVRFIATLDGGGAPRMLEAMWAWALERAGSTTPAKPQLSYGIDRAGDETVVWMQFTGVTKTGEPHLVRFVHSPSCTRMFLLEHSEYASELDHAPRAIVCESMKDGKHVNWGVVLAPDDEVAFARTCTDKIHPPS